MPTYTYECPNCGQRKEKFHRINGEVEVFCSKCGERMRRLIGAGAGLLFKGEGFYITDYGSGKRAEEARKQDTKDGKKAENST